MCRFLSSLTLKKTRLSPENRDMLPAWYGSGSERPVDWSAQPTLHEHAEREKLTFTRQTKKASQMVWVTNESGKEFAMCCYLKTNFCDFIIPMPGFKKKGRLSSTLSRHVHAFSKCACGNFVPLPISRKFFPVSTLCFRCEELLNTNKERAKILDTQASDLQLQEETLMLDFQRRGEALQNQADELRLQQNRLNKATQDHKKAVKKAQEQHAKCAKDLAASCQGKRTKVMSLQYTNIK